MGTSSLREYGPIAGGLRCEATALFLRHILQNELGSCLSFWGRFSHGEAIHINHRLCSGQVHDLESGA